jgi:hypothetical protein
VYYQLTANTIIGILSNGSLTRYPAVKLSADDGTLLPYRKGGFSFGFHVADDAERFRELPRDICGYDYYVVDTNSQLAQMAPLVQFNLIMRNIFINRTMTEVFSNGAVSILRNNDKGGACVPA